MSGDEYETPAGEEKTDEAGVLDDVEIAELERINELQATATIDDSASMDDRLSAVEACQSLLLLYEMEEHRDPAKLRIYEGTVNYLKELYQEQDDQNKHKFALFAQNLSEMLVENIIRLMESNGGQSHPA